MILTITPNTALDEVLEVEHYVPGERLGIQKETLCIGGKGNLTSIFAVDLGARSVSLGFAAGENGRKLPRMLRERGVRADFSPARGETRRIRVIVDAKRQVQTWLVPETLRVTRVAERDLEKRAAHWIPNARWLALCGSLPPGCSPHLYYHLTRRAHASSVPVLIDSRGAALAHALAAQPEVVRLNKQELQQTLGEPIPNLQSVLAALRRLLVEGLQFAVCSLGAEGAVAVTSEGGWRTVPPKIAQRSSAGSGDAFTAALLVWREKGAEWPEALRWATAAGTAKAQEACTDHPLDLRRVHALCRRVRLIRL
ncbi:MAG: hexose kinase [Acidobacteriia bacterium]|nr:hexose kinase [Terriglobia bacterium]